MNIQDLIIKDREEVNLRHVFLSEENKHLLNNLIKEHLYREEIQHYGLPINNKLLIYGNSGCGKTMSAKAIATSLGKPLIILNLSNIIHSRIGETSQNIKQIFDRAIREKAVLFLDEFDQIAKSRTENDNDVGEMRRLVNTIIQLIDYFSEDALLICATNHVEIIDQALLRRFQLRIHFELPSDDDLNNYYEKTLLQFPINLHPSRLLYGISYAEARDYCFSQIKSKLILQLESR